MKPTELSFKTLCQFFEAVAKAPRNKKLIKLRSLLEKNLERESDELYEVFRLILPYVSLSPSAHAVPNPPHFPGTKRCFKFNNLDLMTSSCRASMHGI